MSQKPRSTRLLLEILGDPRMMEMASRVLSAVREITSGGRIVVKVEPSHRSSSEPSSDWTTDREAARKGNGAN